jgi:CheY-like chemotaxis protein
MARVQIVDDNPDVRELMLRIFRLHGHDAHAFADGAGLLAELHRGRADLCVVDWMLPGMDGVEVLSAIRDDPDPQLAGTPVVILSAVAPPGVVRVAREAGADDYLSKDLPLGQVLRRVRQHLRDVATPA